jgi:hypothetical protein
VRRRVANGSPRGKERDEGVIDFSLQMSESGFQIAQTKSEFGQVRICAVSLAFQAADPDQATASAPGRLHTQHFLQNAPADDLSNAALQCRSSDSAELGQLDIDRVDRGCGVSGRE